MREHTHLAAMVGFVRKHVAQHFHANRPRLSPAVSKKLLDAAPTSAERFREHLGAASGALGQSCAGLLRRTVRAVELWWNLQVRSGKPDPLGADIVHVREDRRNGAGLAGRFGSPGGRVKMFDKDLVYAIIGGKNLSCDSAELSVNLALARGHGSLARISHECDDNCSRIEQKQSVADSAIVGPRGTAIPCPYSRSTFRRFNKDYAPDFNSAPNSGETSQLILDL
jgi:hypothetical protein